MRRRGFLALLAALFGSSKIIYDQIRSDTISLDEFVREARAGGYLVTPAQICEIFRVPSSLLEQDRRGPLKL